MFYPNWKDFLSVCTNGLLQVDPSISVKTNQTTCNSNLIEILLKDFKKETKYAYPFS